MMLVSQTATAKIRKHVGEHDTNCDHSDRSGYRALALAVIERAVADLYCDHHVDGLSAGSMRRDALRFLTATSGDDRVMRMRWCDLAGIEPAYLERMVARRLIRQ